MKRITCDHATTTTTTTITAYDANTSYIKYNI